MRRFQFTPECYQVVQTMRRLYVEAGPEGRYGNEHWTVDQTNHPGWSDDGLRMCLLVRYQTMTGRVLGPAYSIEIRRALYAVGCKLGLVSLNDHEGYDATVAVLDRLLTECRPPSLRELNEREMEKLL